jgi:hypothetical protein
MEETINTGRILIKEGTLLPECLQLESEPYSKGWKLVKNLDARGLDRKIREAGWTFFFMANEVNATAIGSDPEKTTRRAVKKAIAYMKSDRLNCLQIAQVAVKRFLGLPYVAVSAHPRHVQESMFLFQAKSPCRMEPGQITSRLKLSIGLTREGTALERNGDRAGFGLRTPTQDSPA